MPNGRLYRTGYTPQQQGGGFFNPWMKSPDIAGGINMLTGMIAQRQAQEQQMQQQEWQRGITEERLGLERMQEERLGQPTIPDWVKQAQMLVQTGQAPDMGTAIRMVKKIETPEEEAERRRQIAEAVGTGRYAPIKGITQPPINVKTFSTSLKDGIRRYQSRIDDLEKPLAPGEIAMGMFTGTGQNLLQQKATGRDNMMSAQAELIRIQTEMAETNKMPSGVDVDLAQTLLQFVGRAEKEKEFWKTKKPTLTDRNTVMFEGKEYPLNADGTVTIEGKTFTIKRK